MKLQESIYSLEQHLVNMDIEFEEWLLKYKPRKNRVTKNSLYNGHMFETCGKDIEFLRDSRIPREYLWTLIDCENEEQYIVPGWHLVDRAGYFMTKIPWKDENIQVNMNEMITVGKAKYLCIEFLTDELGLPEDLFEDKIHDWFSHNT